MSMIACLFGHQENLSGRVPGLAVRVSLVSSRLIVRLVAFCHENYH